MNVARARQVAMFLAREVSQASLNTIGKHFGKRDHSTVVYACKTIENKIKKDGVFKKHIENLMNKLSKQK